MPFSHQQSNKTTGKAFPSKRTQQSAIIYDEIFVKPKMLELEQYKQKQIEEVGDLIDDETRKNKVIRQREEQNKIKVLSPGTSQQFNNKLQSVNPRSIGLGNQVNNSNMNNDPDKKRLASAKKAYFKTQPDSALDENNRIIKL